MRRLTKADYDLAAFCIGLTLREHTSDNPNAIATIRAMEELLELLMDKAGLDEEIKYNYR
jgi:hypothetical protein